MEEFMTVFFNKRTGSIKALVGGEQNMSMYGDEQEDYELIYDFTVVPYDSYVFQNFVSFSVIDGQLKMMKSDIPSQYL